MRRYLEVASESGDAVILPTAIIAITIKQETTLDIYVETSYCQD